MQPPKAFLGASGALLVLGAVSQPLRWYRCYTVERTVLGYLKASRTDLFHLKEFWGVHRAELSSWAAQSSKGSIASPSPVFPRPCRHPTLTLLGKKI